MTDIGTPRPTGTVLDHDDRKVHTLMGIVADWHGMNTGQRLAAAQVYLPMLFAQSSLAAYDMLDEAAMHLRAADTIRDGGAGWQGELHAYLDETYLGTFGDARSLTDGECAARDVARDVLRRTVERDGLAAAQGIAA